MERRDHDASTERRQGPPRDTCSIAASLDVGQAKVPCVITDISPAGAKISLEASRALPPTFNLVIPIDKDLDETRRCELRWRVGDRTGVRFLV